jgi:DNA polymerase (family 10)
MSKVRQRFAYGDVHGMALTAQETVARHAQRVAIAGSIRRFRTHVGDIDLVVQVDETDPWVKQRIGTALAELRWMPVREGEHIASYAIPGRVVEPAVDLYFATPQTWGITLLVRTGSAAHNIKLTQVGARMAPARKLSVARGILDTAGNVVASRTEEEIFGALGMRWVEPAEREAPELDYMVRSED